MPGTIRYHIDESCRLSVARALREQGLDVTTTSEAKLLGATDDVQLVYASESGRVFFTNDSDFLAMHEAHVAHTGLVYCHQNSRTIGETVRLLVLLWELYDADEMVNRLEYL
ncbi:MAG: DUF5615 family PIN-like protein [Planctomycetota bacterium]